MEYRYEKVSRNYGDRFGAFRHGTGGCVGATGGEARPGCRARRGYGERLAAQPRGGARYFKLRKAYVAALQRCEEIIAGNVTFSKIDEALYIAGKSELYLSQGKGKQKPSMYVRHEGNEKRTLTPEEFRAEARAYLSQLIDGYPDSKFKSEAVEDLKALGGPKPKDSKQ